MTAPKKGTGSGTSFELSNDGGSTWKKFMSVSKVTPPEYTRNTVDLTDNSSFDSNNQMKEFGTGFIEGGDLKVEGALSTRRMRVSALRKPVFTAARRSRASWYLPRG